MTDQEFENIIKKTLKTDISPDRASLTYTLSHITEMESVTENSRVRYNNSTAMPSYIINNKIADIVNIWKSKRLVLVPSLILLLFIGTFSLSAHTGKYNLSIEQLAEQNEQIEEPGVVDDDEPVILTNFDDPSINDLGIISNEL